MALYRLEIAEHTYSAKNKGCIRGPVAKPVDGRTVFEVEASNAEEAHRLLSKTFRPNDTRPLAGLSYTTTLREKWYEGDPQTRRVMVTTAKGKQRYELPLYLEVGNHSPCGFCWGYCGSGPSQLALAIAMDIFNDVESAIELADAIKTNIIAKTHMDKVFTVRESDIRRIAARMAKAPAKCSTPDLLP